MNKLTSIVTTLIIGLSLGLGSVSDAEAKRFGGGGSFGGKSSFNKPYQRSASPAKAAPTRQQQQAQAQNQAAKQKLASRGGLMGMLGGLALGGLLGAMLFGGAFENFNFMDILVFGGIAFLLYKLFAARAKNAARPVPAYSRESYEPQQRSSSAYNDYEAPQAQETSRASVGNTGFNTDLLFKKGPQANNDSGFEPAIENRELILPEGFDEHAFLNGAENAFRALQTAWDDRDLAEIRGLTTDRVFAEIQDQLKASTDDNRTEVVSVQAELLDVRESGSELEATVLFDSLLREDIYGPEQAVREVWHFVKPRNSLQPKWYLDGIQQVEE
ncbi:MAG: 39S ribosomal protein L45 [Gammaproteobacteria bacterium]|jgi:predicted lipid-binding transport protein (Tim44 family)|uniref:Tim44 domain-containing protein n=1 Tax=Methylotuvimicrobium sp. TaxID=2822413 RepID=UPI001DC639A3|nr:39S ribosomal protein L45 [Gammaproteobacteria bacterium]